MNTMQKAFETAGLRPEDVALDMAIAKYLNSGGTIERAQARLIEIAKRMPDRGQACAVASSDLLVFAPTRQPVEDGEAIKDVPQGHSHAASPSSSNRGGEGRSDSAPMRHGCHALSVREPSPAYLKAAGESRLESARNVLSRYRTSTGVLWGDVHPYEVASMSRDHVRGVALMSVLGSLNPKQMKMTFSELMTPKQARIAMEKADKELVNVA